MAASPSYRVSSALQYTDMASLYLFVVCLALRPLGKNEGVGFSCALSKPMTVSLAPRVSTGYEPCCTNNWNISPHKVGYTYTDTQYCPCAER